MDIGYIYIYIKQKCLSSCLSVRPSRLEGDGGGGGEGQQGGAMERVDFTDGMPEWRYFSRATSGHPASRAIKQKCLSVHLSVHHVWMLPRKTGRVDRKERGNGEGDF